MYNLKNTKLFNYFVLLSYNGIVEWRFIYLKFEVKDSREIHI